MNCYDTNIWNIFGNTLAEKSMDSNLMQMWSESDHNMSRFYTTGFETILFNRDHSFVLETVLASSVGWDNEIIIVGNHDSLGKLSKIANKQNLTHHCLGWFSEKWDDFENGLPSYNDVSHILIGIDSETDLRHIPVKKLLQLSARHKFSLIVYCDTSVTGLNDLFEGSIDYMIGGLEVEPIQSFVVARRSRLVQTEGKSNCFNLDLHSFWQWTMRNREPIIEPMRV